MSQKKKIKAQLLVSGMLVLVKSSVRGNTTYYKQQLEYAALGSAGEERSKWETTKVVFDPAEQDEANKVRDKARSLIASVCAKSDHGLICPQDNLDELADRIDEAEQIVADFNSSAALTHVGLHIICGELPRDDVRAVEAIGQEIRDLLQDVQVALAEMDVKKVRALCDKAVNVGKILTPEAYERAKYAIDLARNAATEIKKAGEAAAITIDQATIRNIEAARTSFLDLDSPFEMAIELPKPAARAVDFEAPKVAPLESLAAAVRQFEFDEKPV